VRGDTASRLARGVERVAGRPLVAGGAEAP